MAVFITAVENNGSWKYGDFYRNLVLILNNGDFMSQKRPSEISKKLSLTAIIIDE